VVTNQNYKVRAAGVLVWSLTAIKHVKHKLSQTFMVDAYAVAIDALHMVHK